jgi:hypothetical protein
VPEELAPSKPTRAEKKTAARRARYFGHARAANDAPVATAPPSAGYVYATTGTKPARAAAPSARA